MSQWVRNAVMMIVVLVWALVVVWSLIRGVLPDPITWGVPGAIYFALNPTIPRRTPEAPKAGPTEGQP